MGIITPITRVLVVTSLGPCPTASSTTMTLNVLSGTTTPLPIVFELALNTPPEMMNSSLPVLAMRAGSFSSSAHGPRLLLAACGTMLVRKNVCWFAATVSVRSADGHMWPRS